MAITTTIIHRSEIIITDTCQTAYANYFSMNITQKRILDTFSKILEGTLNQTVKYNFICRVHTQARPVKQDCWVFSNAAAEILPPSPVHVIQHIHRVLHH
jgi:hypothetical protein